MNDPVVTTTAGMIRGTREGGIARFLGVPYAADPVGARRFLAPEPAEAWQGVRDATVQGPTAPQSRVPFPSLDVEALVGPGWRPGAAYLNVNIWAPDIWAADPPAGAAPVMVFIHGGGFVLGGNDAPVTEGSAVARSGVVCMAINYRLAIEGFVPIPGVATNLGLRDQIAALAWVRDNAAAFGGDAGNVTIFGESAGAMSVADLIASPLANGLFHRAIIQSGHGAMVRPLPVAARLTRKLAKLLRVPPTAAGFAACTTEQCLAAVERVSKPSLFGLDLRDDTGREPAFGISKFLPVTGDDVLPQAPLDALRRGAGAACDVLIGSNAEEMNLYFVPTGAGKKINRLLAWFLLSRVHPNARAILRAYGMGKSGQRAGAVFIKALSDLVFRMPARLFAAAHQGRTHVYEFEWRSPMFGGELGACHAMELPFVFDTLATCTGPRGLAGEAPPQAVADRIHRIWVDFAASGALPWPEYKEGDRQVFQLASGQTVREAIMPAEAFARENG